MPQNIRPFPARGLAGVFKLLYHQFAWSYDAVAWVVSSGRWQGWALSSLELLDSVGDGLVLELGYGPGHLQLEMAKRGVFCAGIDESRQMSRMARRRFKKAEDVGKFCRLVRGDAENLPFANGSAAAILATFPAEYIFNNKTIENWRRVLAPKGQLIILMGVEPGSFSIINVLMRLIYRAADAEFKNILGPQNYLDRIREFGFEIEPKSVVYKKDRLWYLFGNKNQSVKQVINSV